MPPALVSTSAVPLPVRRVVCARCGWTETSGGSECRSCGAALTGMPERAPEAASRPVMRQAPVYRPEPMGRTSSGSLIRGKAILAVVAMVLLVFWWQSGRPVRYPAGMLVGEAPQQGPVEGVPPWKLKDGSQVIPLATYEIRARLLHRERYRFDNMADIAPVDFGVGWYRMSDQSTIDQFSFSNSGRFLSFTTPDRDLAALCADCTANMHLLPANDRVRDRLLNIGEGQIFSARGYLVSVVRPGMNPWSSSLTREDTGNGACEIMWVEAIRTVEPPGRP